MKDIPVFTTENGVASLFLKEIPYTETAYILLRDSQEPEKLIEECRDFCRVVGAEHIYATGHPVLQQFPFHTAVWEMSALRDALPDTDAALFPVTEVNLEQWRSIYNEAMRSVPNASYMSFADGKEMQKKGDGYFIHRGEVLLGIGKASGSSIAAVVSLLPGSGRDIVLALNHALADSQVYLEVASANTRAVALYERMGFIKTKELSCWYKIL